MLLVVLVEQSGTAGTAWNKCWDSLDRPSQLDTLLGELGFWDNWTVLSSTVQVRVGLLMNSIPLNTQSINGLKQVSQLCPRTILHSESSRAR